MLSGTARVAGLLLLLAAPLALHQFALFQLALLMSYVIAVLALSILTGGSGQVSLGQSAFYGLGAYISGMLIEHAGVNYAFTLPISGAVCFGFGFLFGLPALRLTGAYLALATFALAVAAPHLVKLDILAAWTGGVEGIVLSKPSAPFGIAVPQDVWLYYFALTVTGAIYWGASNLLDSRSGRAMKAIRDNEIAASAIGVNVALYKTLAFGVSAGLTGIAGALGAIVVQYVSPDSYTIHLAIAIFLAMVIGGVGWLPGSFAGAAFIVFVPNIAEEISKGLSGAVFGALLFLVIFLFPNGAQDLFVLAKSRVCASLSSTGKLRD